MEKGMIAGQMGGAAPQAGPPQPGMPADQGMPPGRGGAAAETPPQGGDSPEYEAALDMAMKGLYEQGIAKDIAKQIAGSDDPMAVIADAAYQVVQIVDEQVQGVPDEDLVPLATQVLLEISEVAEAAGAQIDGKVVMGAMRQMVLRFAKEMGGDTTQLEQALAQVNEDELMAQAEGMQAGQA